MPIGLFALHPPVIRILYKARTQVIRRNAAARVASTDSVFHVIQGTKEVGHILLSRRRLNSGRHRNGASQEILQFQSLMADRCLVCTPSKMKLEARNTFFQLVTSAELEA